MLAARCAVGMEPFLTMYQIPPLRDWVETREVDTLPGSLIRVRASRWSKIGSKEDIRGHPLKSWSIGRTNGVTH